MLINITINGKPQMIIHNLLTIFTIQIPFGYLTNILLADLTNSLLIDLAFVSVYRQPRKNFIVVFWLLLMLNHQKQLKPIIIDRIHKEYEF